MIVTFGELGRYGRTGNALFQLSAAIGYAKKHNIDFVFPKWAESHLFNIDSKYFLDTFRVQNKYEEKNFFYEEIPFLPNVTLHGYFQSPKYFEHCEQDIRTMLMPKNMGEPLDYCSVHVRRGDYVKLADFHTNLDVAGYYFKAMEMIPSKNFLIVSDDPEWCRKNFIGNDFTIKSPASGIDDLKTLISCKNNIIANSSFSWWGAYLNTNVDKKIIAPSNWFGPKLRDTHPIYDLIPKTWSLI